MKLYIFVEISVVVGILLLTTSAAASLIGDTVTAEIIAHPDTAPLTVVSGDAVVAGESPGLSGFEFEGFDAEQNLVGLAVGADSFWFRAYNQLTNEDPFSRLPFVYDVVLSDMDWLPIPNEITDVSVTGVFVPFDPANVTVESIGHTTDSITFRVIGNIANGEGLGFDASFEATPIPEPASLLLAGLASLICCLRRRR